MFFKWIFKTACAVLIVTNTWNIVMGVFDVAQQIINNASGVVIGNVNIDIASHFADLERTAHGNGRWRTARSVAAIVHRRHQYVVPDDLHFPIAYDV
jgi:hypothetical protein